MLIYIDDILLTSNNSALINHLITFVARVRRRGEYSTSNLKYIYVYLSGKYGETRNSCLLLVKKGMGVATGILITRNLNSSQTSSKGLVA